MINQVAGYAVNHRRVANGEIIGVSADEGSLFARLVAGTPVGGVPVQAIVEPRPNMAPLRTILSTAMLWLAHRLSESGNEDGARGVLAQSLAWFPGEPGVAAPFATGDRYNWQNNLGYLAMCELTEEDDEADYLEAAFARSEALEREYLGDTRFELAPLSPEALLAIAEQIVSQNAALAQLVGNFPLQAPSPAVAVSPSLLVKRVDTGEGIVAQRRMALLPEPMARYFGWCRDPGIARLATEILLTLRARPSALAGFTDDARRIYTGDEDSAPSVGAAEPYHMGTRAMSLVIASVARQMAAGLTVAEIRAVASLDDRRPLAESGAHKLAILSQEEGRAYVASMGG